MLSKSGLLLFASGHAVISSSGLLPLVAILHCLWCAAVLGKAVSILGEEGPVLELGQLPTDDREHQ